MTKGQSQVPISPKKDDEDEVFVPTMGGAILGNIIAPGIGGVIVGGIIGYVAASLANKHESH